MLDLALIAVAYLLGSLPTGVLLGRLFGVDVRGSGSGNIGATNVARSVGAGAGILTLLGDVGKGVIAVLLARAYADHPIVVPASGVAALLGHIFSIFLGFSGGKGVATGLGVMIPLAPKVVLPGIVVFGVVLALTRFVSVASLAGAWTLPAFLILFGTDAPTLIACILLCGLITFRHQENLQRLRAGAESRFGRGN